MGYRSQNPANGVGNIQHPQIVVSGKYGVNPQHREACNGFYDALPAVVEKYMKKVNEKLGTNYDLFNYYGAEDADRVIIAMGSICDVAEEVIDYLTAQGKKSAAIQARKNEMLGQVYHMLSLTLGEPVKEFTYAFRD